MKIIKLEIEKYKNKANEFYSNIISIEVNIPYAVQKNLRDIGYDIKHESDLKILTIMLDYNYHRYNYGAEFYTEEDIKELKERLTILKNKYEEVKNLTYETWEI